MDPAELVRMIAPGTAHRLLLHLAWVWAVVLSLTLGAYLGFGEGALAQALMPGTVLASLLLLQSARSDNWPFRNRMAQGWITAT